jgi:hypothetical protein
LPSPLPTQTQLDPGRSPGRKNITITNTTDYDVFVKRLTDTGDTLSGFQNPHIQAVTHTETTAPTSAALITDFTYRIPAKSTLDDPCGDSVAYFAAMQTGSGNVIVQECF